MIEIISGSLYKEICDKIIQTIDFQKLPLFGEKEIAKHSCDRYGKVKIKLDFETDIDIIRQIESYRNIQNSYDINYFTYKWDVEETILPQHFETYIKPEVIKLIELLSIFKDRQSSILRFSVVGGSYKETERPLHDLATQFALIEIFKQL